MTATVPEVRPLRPSHRRVLQLFRTFGPQTHEEALQAAISDGWPISPSGLRTLISELVPPRGRGIRDSGKKRQTWIAAKRRYTSATIWELDASVDEPFAGRMQP